MGGFLILFYSFKTMGISDVHDRDIIYIIQARNLIQNKDKGEKDKELWEDCWSVDTHLPSFA